MVVDKSKPRAPLKGPVKWACFHLNVILDILYRYVLGWLIAARGISVSRTH